MSKPTLFVCQSCRLAGNDDDSKPSDGALLLDQLRALHQQSSRQSELTIESVGCLWTCHQACTVALQDTNKCTYLLTHLPAFESAEALMQFSELYIDSDTGNIPWKKIPDVLKTETIGLFRLKYA